LKEGDNPILNSPYDEPLLHYATDDEGALDYSKVVKGRRIFTPEIQVIPVRQGPQQTMFEVNERAAEFGTHLINLTRKEVGAWRDAGYPGVTRVSKELLAFWFLDVDRHADQRLFFAQREAAETTVWLNEYFPDFIARMKVDAASRRVPGSGGDAASTTGRTVNLIIEVTGMNKDKAAKRWYVENRWLPAVNAVREKYGYDEWAFIEIANDIRDIKNQLIAKIGELSEA
jgi:hypothetical protein